MNLRKIGRISLLLLLLWLGVSLSNAQTSTSCQTRALQALIDRAASGSTIAIAAGVCSVNLIVNKNLTLRGANSDKTILKGAQPGKPVLYIASEEPIEVTVENLSLADAPKLSGDKDCAIFYPELICPSGFEVRGKAHAVLRNARVAGNAWVGVYVLDSSRALVQNAEIVGNGWGVYLSGDAQVTVEDSRVLTNRQVGVEAWAAITVKNSKISGNGDGIKVVLDQAKISNNTISENAGHGLLLTGSARTEVQGNEIFKNGGWGITAWLRQCGFTNNNFSGQVSASDNKVQENREGQICLP